jgi:hypothetical protein
MKRLSGLFRKPPAPPPPPPPNSKAATQTQRIAALDVAPAEVLANIALGNDDPNLPPRLRQAAHERLAQLVDDGTIDFAEFFKGREQQPETMTVAALCKDPHHLRQLLDRIDDPAELAKLAVDGPASRVRQAAAALIHDPAQLQDLLPKVRGKDKSVYKIIKQKCDALIAIQRQADEIAREAEAVCASLERHGAKSFDALYAATLDVLATRWRALPAEGDPSVQERSLQALERCREVIAAHEQELARLAAERAAKLAADQEARDARERAHEAEQRATAERAEADARALADETAAREAEDHARAEQHAAETHAVRELRGLIRLARAALQAGNTRKAARFRQAIEDALQAAPAVPIDLTRSLQQLDEKLNELRQWKDYVAAPKRIELIEEMEALVGSKEEPQELAEHIRALQQEWRTINKGIASDVSDDAVRFQKAHQAAFKPCQEFFAAQATIRRENLAGRKSVLERLKAFAASQGTESPDYSLISRVLREAPQEWRSHSPVDREPCRPVEQEFHQALDGLRAILNAWYERNVADKNALITQARHLSTIEDSGQATDGVKRLQAQWRDTGPVSRDESQRLWDDFRAACDAVYQRREQAHVQQLAALQTAKAQAVALCEEIEQAGSVPATDRATATAKVREWRAASETVGELPRADTRGLNDRFERAIARYEAGLAEQDRRDAEAVETNVFEAARHIRVYERAVMLSAPAEERDALKAAAEAFIASVQRWPKGALQALKQALARAASATLTDDAAREKALRLLCIRCELLSSTPTPSEDEELRREYQMRLLMERMGQSGSPDETNPEALRLQWIGIGAIAPELHEELERRFLRSLESRSMKGAATAEHGGRGRGRPDAGSRRY